MTGPAGTSHRVDIQAMRALAVLAVFVYHLWPRVLPGGFVGVDVFFVISGFLIMGNLVREAERTGTIRVRQFWARRIRRLLPAALTVLALTAVAILVLVPANLRPQFLRETIGAAVYVENLVLSANSVDYLAANNAASPVQHFWTLSVEEQFYVVAPLLTVGLLLLARRLHHRRRVLLVAIAAITAGSFGYSIWLTSTSAPSAYFLPTTRAWEFGAGALLVFGTSRTPSTRTARIAVVGGLIGILTSLRVLNGGVPFPGAIAAWPVLAAVAMIWGGKFVGATWLRVAAFRPIQYLGDISYAVYLWHWPLIVIAPFVLDGALGGPGKVAIIAATIVLAGFSTRFIENPIRSARMPSGRAVTSRLTAAFGVAGMAAVVLLAGSGLAAIRPATVQPTADAAEIIGDQPNCRGAMAIAHPDVCVNRIVPSAISPAPAEASSDAFNLPECWATVDAAELHTCSFGPADATVRLAAIGDSHNNALLAAYREIATRNGWRIDVAGHNGCYWTTAVQIKPVEAMVEGCEAWKRSVEAWLDQQVPYRAILVTNARNGYPPRVPAGADGVRLIGDGLVAAWSAQTKRGTRIVAIRDNPAMAADVLTCVVVHLAEANSRCSVAAAKALGPRDALVEAAGRSDDARVVDLTDIYCPDARCIPIIGNVVVYQDKDHITATFAESLVPILSDRIRDALHG